MARIATAAGGGFAVFYTFYTSAPTTLEDTSISAGTRVSIVVLVVVAIQPILLLARNWIRNRRLAVTVALALMGLGSATMPLANQWPGPLLLGLGFGVFVVMSTVWVKEQAAPGQTGRALGIYGFGSAIGGVLGAPVGLYAADHAGLIGVAIAGCAFTVCAIVAARLARNTADDHTKNQPARSPADAGPGASTESSSRAAITTVPLVSFAGHLVAVSLYAAILSSVGTTSRPSEVWLPVVAALLIQVCLAPGRLAGGRLADSCPPLIIFGAAATLSVLGTISFFATSSMLGIFLAVALIGFTSGVGQTAALTALMRRAHTAPVW